MLNLRSDTWWRWRDFCWVFVISLLNFAQASSSLLVFGVWFQNWGAACCLVAAGVFLEGLVLEELAARWACQRAKSAPSQRAKEYMPLLKLRGPEEENWGN
jgi:hypothetical protein